MYNKISKKDEIIKNSNQQNIIVYKETWKIINEIRGKRKTKMNPSFLLNDVITEDRRIITNSFNCYFTQLPQNFMKVIMVSGLN